MRTIQVVEHRYSGGVDYFFITLLCVLMVEDKNDVVSTLSNKSYYTF